MKKLTLAFLGLFLASSLVACAQSATTKGGSEPGGGRNGGFTPAPTVPPMTSAPAPTIILEKTPQYSGVSDATTPDRMIVRTGNMSLVVEDVTVTIGLISKLAENSQGYVVASNSWREGERLRGTISIRVPAGDFEGIVRAIANLAVEVTSQTTSSQDVTEEYVDLTAKLKTLDATEQQLLRIMEKAEKVEDILSVQRELSNTRSQIEQTKGRMQYLEKTSATSLIQVSLEQSKLDAKLTVNRRFIRSGESVQFTAQVAGGFSPYSYQWDFGDSKTSNDPAPAHSYRGAGDYTVSLIVTDDRGNAATAEMKDYVTVQAGWSAGNVAGSAWNGLASFGRGLLSVGIWLGIFSPVWLVIGGIVYWQARRRRKRT
jgi:PKD repeat protein